MKIVNFLPFEKVTLYLNTVIIVLIENSVGFKVKLKRDKNLFYI